MKEIIVSLWNSSWSGTIMFIIGILIGHFLPFKKSKKKENTLIMSRKEKKAIKRIAKNIQTTLWGNKAFRCQEKEGKENDKQ